jgi:MoaA/NifB/PqqE/SkfB family radical SAM enzyme
MKIIKNIGNFESYIYSYRSILLKSMFNRKRLANTIKMAASYYFRKIDVPSYPAFVKIETTGACNLRCPSCAHGAGYSDKIKTESRFMTMETFNRTLDVFGKRSIIFFLYHRGDPLVARDTLLPMAEAAKKVGVATVISTNFSFLLKQDYLDDMVRSGLTHVIVSLDGLTQEAYEKYRVGGKLELVMRNMRMLLEARKRLKSKTPILEWQFIRFSHNEHEMKEAMKVAREMGVDHFTIMRDKTEILCDDFALGKKMGSAKEDGDFPFACKWLWSATLVLHDGEIVPCCYYNFLQKKHFGNINNKDFEEIWNGQLYYDNRKFVLNKLDNPDWKKHYCGKCPFA